MNLTSAIYFHPEAFPPTLNAIGELSKLFDKIYLLHRPHMSNEWQFHNNVELMPSGKPIDIKKQERSSIVRKIGFFFGFTLRLFMLIKKHRPSVVLLYDSIPLLSFFLIKGIIGYKPLLWYHNHDITEKDKLRKFSIRWFAGVIEPKMFRCIDIFSLPAQERKEYFQMNKLKGKYFFLPNMPSRTFYSKFKDVDKDEASIKILFQGSISFSHGIEELMELLPFQINGKPVKLVLKGFLKEPFNAVLEKTIKENSLEDYIDLHGITSYAEVPKITSSCHIGIAIFAKNDIMNQTLGTASNKIYEYAACGLPVLYYDDEHFKMHLSKYKWAVATDLSKRSLLDSIAFIESNYQELSKAARNDFENELNFEKYFDELAEYLGNKG